MAFTAEQFTEMADSLDGIDDVWSHSREAAAMLKQAAAQATASISLRSWIDAEITECSCSELCVRCCALARIDNELTRLEREAGVP